MVVRCLDVMPDDFAVGHLVPSSTNTESGVGPNNETNEPYIVQRWSGGTEHGSATGAVYKDANRLSGISLEGYGSRGGAGNRGAQQLLIHRPGPVCPVM